MFRLHARSRTKGIQAVPPASRRGWTRRGGAGHTPRPPHVVSAESRGGRQPVAGAGRPGPPGHSAARQSRSRCDGERGRPQVSGQHAPREAGGNRARRHRRSRGEPRDAHLSEHRSRAGERGPVRWRRAGRAGGHPAGTAEQLASRGSPPDGGDRPSSGLRRVSRRAVPRPARPLRGHVDDPHRVPARSEGADRPQDRHGALLRHHRGDAGSRPRSRPPPTSRRPTSCTRTRTSGAWRRSRTRASRASTSGSSGKRSTGRCSTATGWSCRFSARCSTRTWWPKSPTSSSASIGWSGLPPSARTRDACTAPSAPPNGTRTRARSCSGCWAASSPAVTIRSPADGSRVGTDPEVRARAAALVRDRLLLELGASDDAHPVV